MKRLANLFFLAIFVVGAVLLSDKAQAHIDNATIALNRISALASR